MSQEDKDKEYYTDWSDEILGQAVIAMHKTIMNAYEHNYQGRMKGVVCIAHSLYKLNMKELLVKSHLDVPMVTNTNGHEINFQFKHISDNEYEKHKKETKDIGNDITIFKEKKDTSTTTEHSYKSNIEMQAGKIGDMAR